jgi:hypothetical protein
VPRAASGYAVRCRIFSGERAACHAIAMRRQVASQTLAVLDARKRVPSIAATRRGALLRARDTVRAELALKRVPRQKSAPGVTARG